MFSIFNSQCKSFNTKFSCPQKNSTYSAHEIHDDRGKNILNPLDLLTHKIYLYVPVFFLFFCCLWYAEKWYGISFGFAVWTSPSKLKRDTDCRLGKTFSFSQIPRSFTFVASEKLTDTESCRYRFGNCRLTFWHFINFPCRNLYIRLPLPCGLDVSVVQHICCSAHQMHTSAIIVSDAHTRDETRTEHSR